MTARVRTEFRSGRFILVCAVLLSATCGTGSVPRASPSPIPTLVPATGLSRTPSVSPTPSYPGLGRFTDPLNRLSYKLAYTDCRTLGVQEVARSYGGDPADPPSVAKAYAAAANPNGAVAATQGCLDALRPPSSQ